MTRATAYQIVTKYLANEKLIKHSLATEATMRSLATRLNADIEEWGIAGLLHDTDYERTKGHPERHGIELFKLEPNSIPTDVEHAIQAHNAEFTNVQPVSPLDWALRCCDDLTILVMVVAMETKSKQLAGITADDVLGKIRQKNFEKDAHKENIFQCEVKLKIPLVEFIDITLKAMQQIHEELGL